MRQVKITDRTLDPSVETPSQSIADVPANTAALHADIKLKDVKENPLWTILVETAQRLPMYAGLSDYIRNELLPNEPGITARELASRLSISLGEALVFLSEFRDE